MADSKTSTALTDNDKLRAAMAKYGVTAGEVVAPQPEVVEKQNFDQLCVRTDPVIDPKDGRTVNGMSGHSGPLMYISATEYSADQDPNFRTKYDRYAGFRVYTIVHPTHGEMVVTHGIPLDGPTPLMQHLAKLDKGNLFQVGSFPTSKGNRVFKAIPVQAS